MQNDYHLMLLNVINYVLGGCVCPPGHRIPDVTLLVHHISSNASLVKVTGLVDAYSE